jgi:hypothetical protein
MNITRANRTLTPLLAGACTLTLLAATAPQPQDEGEAQFTSYEPPVITVEFEGGTVRDYVAVLRGAGDNINIMIDDDAGAVSLPAVELRNVMLIDALRILEDLRPEDESYELSLDEFQSGPIELTTPVFRIVAVKQRPPQPPLQTSVWSVRQLLSSQIEAAHILGAIETALSLQEDLGAPEVRFHEETGLILARAHPEQIEVIGEVIHNLQASVSPAHNNDLEQLSMRLQQTQAALEESNSRAKIAQVEALELSRENERLRTRLDLLTEEMARRGEIVDE